MNMKMPEIHLAPDGGQGGAAEKHEDIVALTRRLTEKYFSGRRPESDFDKLGDIKQIEDKIFLIYKHAHETREHGERYDTLIALDNELKELFRHKGEEHTRFYNVKIGDNGPEQNSSKPEKEFTKIIGLNNNSLEILNGAGETVTVELPEAVLKKGE